MTERLERLNSDLEQRHGITLRMRIGVNTGEVVAEASSGNGQRLVSGEPVNVAARLQAEAQPGSILAGERTYLAARHAFEFSEPVELSLKGKDEVVVARRLLGQAPAITRGIPGLASPLVGRTAELQNLATMVDELLETRQPRLVTVLGPAGVGKTRLVREFLTILREGPPNLRVLRGRCLAAGHGITYWALGEILRDACGIELADSASIALEKLQAEVADDRMRDALALTAGIPVPNSRLAQMTPQAVADELGWAWPRFATWQAQDLAVWVVEDLHWAGDRLLEMLERVIARATGPLLIIATARPDLVESHPGFGGGSENFSTISLRPLSPRQSDELLRGILDVADLPARLGEEILARAEGNPFFLEEIVRRLIEEGALRREGDRWTAAHGTRSTPLPDSLIALLAARIDSVPEREKRVLQEAAVIGKVFWAEPLQRVMADDVNSALLTLERRGLVSARTTSSIANHTEYSFKHVLVRDVAYASIPKARRARAHAEVGAWIEELAGDRAEQFGELIAYHYALAAVGPDADLAWGADELEHVRHEAFERLVTAGTQARRRFAVSKSLELHEQALPLASNDAEKLRVLEEIADDHTSAYQGDDARRFYFQGLELTRKLGDRGSQARVHAKLADLMTALPGAFKSSPDPKEIEPIIAEGLAGAT
ncbi:MAG TPA: AAA family ATPase, partial [Candidatus Dormibacteraeota bacterium]|nr:AAA family ATPase [Candidatus Dormibacteraeota bacterium]